ncbi:MAG: hypothetical protein IKD66_11965 [Solobacterium sp.]|nr:hypothetical protein [Solobacterium sp.]
MKQNTQKANTLIREKAKEYGLCLWQVADMLNISYDGFIRKLRHELSEEERDFIISVIENGGKQ